MTPMSTCFVGNIQKRVAMSPLFWGEEPENIGVYSLRPQSSLLSQLGKLFFGQLWFINESARNNSLLSSQLCRLTRLMGFIENEIVPSTSNCWTTVPILLFRSTLDNCCSDLFELIVSIPDLANRVLDPIFLLVAIVLAVDSTETIGQSKSHRLTLRRLP